MSIQWFTDMPKTEGGEILGLSPDSNDEFELLKLENDNMFLAHGLHDIKNQFNAIALSCAMLEDDLEKGLLKDDQELIDISRKINGAIFKCLSDRDECLTETKIMEEDKSPQNALLIEKRKNLILKATIEKVEDILSLMVGFNQKLRNVITTGKLVNLELEASLQSLDDSISKIEAIKKECLRVIQDLNSGESVIPKTAIKVIPFLQNNLGKQRMVARIRNPQNIEEIWINEHRFSRVIQNLVSNAEKYGNADIFPIEITLKEEGNWQIIEVKDRGIGLPVDKEKRKEIFRMFKQGKKDNSGFGIGLAACKAICLAHGGKIFARNNADGQGSTFIVRIPKVKI